VAVFTSVVWGEWRLGMGLERPLLCTTYLAFLRSHTSVIPTCTNTPIRNCRLTIEILRQKNILLHTATMANNVRYYYSLPTEAPQRSRSGSRRPPLTPSTVSSPCLTTLVSLPRRDSAGSASSPTKAHAMLAKVVSSPPTPRSETPSSLAGSPSESRTTAYHTSPASSYTSPASSYERPGVWRSESDRYVRQYRQQGKHFIPDVALGTTDIDFVQMATSLSQTLRSSVKARITTSTVSRSGRE
jgi:hypothetical protein